MKFATGLLFAVLGWSGENTLVIRNATVHPVTSGEILNASVLIKDGLIAEIGGPKLQVPKGTPVIEAKGLHLYPGLINSATRLGLVEIASVRETTDATELGEFNPQLRALIAVNPVSQNIAVTRANGITTALTMPAGGVIGGQAALIHLDGWTWEEMALQKASAVHLKFPVLTMRTGGFPGPPRTLPYAEARQKHDENLARLNEFFENARRYRQAKSATGSAVKLDLKLEAMLPVLEGRLPVMIQAGREREVREALEFADRQKIRLILSQVRELGGNLEKIKAKNIPVILGETLSLPLDEDDPYDSQFTLPVELNKAGVLFAFGTFDEAANFTDRNLPYNAAASVPFGLPVDAALKAVTINPAKIWGVDSKIGSIEKGKWADLILTDGDPLETKTQIKRMWIQGRAVSLENKQTQLYEKYLNRP